MRPRTVVRCTCEAESSILTTAQLWGIAPAAVAVGSSSHLALFFLATAPFLKITPLRSAGRCFIRLAKCCTICPHNVCAPCRPILCPPSCAFHSSLFVVLQGGDGHQLRTCAKSCASHATTHLAMKASNHLFYPRNATLMLTPSSWGARSQLYHWVHTITLCLSLALQGIRPHLQILKSSQAPLARGHAAPGFTAQAMAHSTHVLSIHTVTEAAQYQLTVLQEQLAHIQAFARGMSVSLARLAIGRQRVARCHASWASISRTWVPQINSPVGCAQSTRRRCIWQQKLCSLASVTQTIMPTNMGIVCSASQASHVQSSRGSQSPPCHCWLATTELQTLPSTSVAAPMQLYRAIAEAPGTATQVAEVGTQPTSVTPDCMGFIASFVPKLIIITMQRASLTLLTALTAQIRSLVPSFGSPQPSRVRLSW